MTWASVLPLLCTWCPPLGGQTAKAAKSAFFLSFFFRSVCMDMDPWITRSADMNAIASDEPRVREISSHSKAGFPAFRCTGGSSNRRRCLRGSVQVFYAVNEMFRFGLDDRPSGRSLARLPFPLDSAADGCGCALRLECFAGGSPALELMPEHVISGSEYACRSYGRGSCFRACAARLESGKSDLLATFVKYPLASSMFPCAVAIFPKRRLA